MVSRMPPVHLRSHLSCLSGPQIRHPATPPKEKTRIKSASRQFQHACEACGEPAIGCQALAPCLGFQGFHLPAGTGCGTLPCYACEGQGYVNTKVPLFSRSTALWFMLHSSTTLHGLCSLEVQAGHSLLAGLAVMHAMARSVFACSAFSEYSQACAQPEAQATDLQVSSALLHTGPHGVPLMWRLRRAGINP